MRLGEGRDMGPEYRHPTEVFELKAPTKAAPPIPYPVMAGGLAAAEAVEEWMRRKSAKTLVAKLQSQLERSRKRRAAGTTVRLEDLDRLLGLLK